MTNQIQVADELNQIVQIGEFGVNELMTMKETIGKDLTIPQFNLFMYQCNRMGLDPALKHAFPIIYGGKLDSRVSYEGLLSLAKKSEGYQGVFNQVVCDNEVDSFEAETDDEGVFVKISHKVRFPRGKVVAAYSVAKRDGYKPVIILMDVAEVAKMLKGQNQKFWKMEDGSPDPDMFKKHVGFRAIKAQYDIASVVEENMESINTPEPYTEPTRRDITAEATETPMQPEPPQEPQQEPTQPNETAIIMAEIVRSFRALGITAKADQSARLAKDFAPKKDKHTLAELKAILKALQLELEDNNDGLGELE